MHRSGGLPDGLAGSPLFPSWPDYITNMSGYDFRKGQVTFQQHSSFFIP
jgi:hypothetical protein